MKDFIVKQEEQNIETPQSIYQPIHNKINKRQDFDENQQFQEIYLKVVDKFLYALNNLQIAQYYSQNQSIPIYPFVFQCSLNEVLVQTLQNKQVHLGGYKIDIKNVSIRNGQLKMQQCTPRQILHQQPSIKLSIQKRKRISMKEEKDTKNIPKNYCKAIISFASKNQALCYQILGDQLKVVKFLERITVYKQKLLNIRIFSELLSQSEDPDVEEFNQTFRILSRIFIKKLAINYIFNSKIVQHNWHLRYRQQIYKGIKNPKNFSHIKKL